MLCVPSDDVILLRVLLTKIIKITKYAIFILICIGFRLPLYLVQNHQFSICLIREDRKSVILAGKVSLLTMVLSGSKTDNRPSEKCLCVKY